MIIKKKVHKPQTIEVKPIVEEKAENRVDEDKIDLFDLDNIDFQQRQERRRGDRRRGFRRIDDRNLISRAREEAAAIKESALKEGYEEGLQRAQEDINEIRNSLISFLSAKQEVFEYIAPDILEISVDIARKIIKREVQQNPNLIIDNITDILKKLSREETKISLRVNPSQVVFLRKEIPEVINQVGLDAKITVIPDETVYEGGCMVTTTNGIIDATIDAQLDVISEALKEI